MKLHYLDGWCLFAAITVAVLICVEPAEAQRGRGRNRSDSAWQFLAKKYDQNKDGKVTMEEYTRGEDAFKSLDRNGDSVITSKDWTVRTRRKRGSSRAPSVGEMAPDFELTRIDNADVKVKLSGFSGKKPVALLFGSCT